MIHINYSTVHNLLRVPHRRNDDVLFWQHCVPGERKGQAWMRDTWSIQLPTGLSAFHEAINLVTRAPTTNRYCRPGTLWITLPRMADYRSVWRRSGGVTEVDFPLSYTSCGHTPVRPMGPTSDRHQTNNIRTQYYIFSIGLVRRRFRVLKGCDWVHSIFTVPQDPIYSSHRYETSGWQ